MTGLHSNQSVFSTDSGGRKEERMDHFCWELNPEMAEEGGCGVYALSSISLWLPANSQQDWGVTVSTFD